MEIPNLGGWGHSRFADLCVLITRGTAPTYVDDSPILAIGQRCVQVSGFNVHAARPHDRRNKRVLRAVPGDVLLNSTGTGTIGRSCVFDVDGDFMVDSHVTVLRPASSKVAPVWLDSLLRSQWGQRYLESQCFSGSTNQVELSRSQLLETRVPVPPLGEQRRIAEILNALDAQMATGRDELAKREVVRSGLAADCADRAIVGAGEWRGLGHVAEVASGVTLGSEPGGGSSVSLPYLRVANVQDGYFDTSDMKSLRVLRSEVGRYSLEPGDLLLTEGGDWDKLGRGAIWDGRINPCLYQNHIFRVRCDRRLVVPGYLALYVASPAGRAYFARIAKQTSNLATINSTELKAMPVPLPSLDTQRKLVASLNAFDEAVRAASQELSSIESLREGVMEDLLTGRVRV